MSRRRRRGGRGCCGLVLGLFVAAVLVVAFVSQVGYTPSDIAGFFHDKSESMEKNKDDIKDKVTGTSDSKDDSQSSHDDSHGSDSTPDKATLKKLKKIDTVKYTDVDYDRANWKHWEGSPCDARDKQLKKQGKNVKTGDYCKIESGKWTDPFTGDTYTDSSKMDMDHVVPLGYTASHGGVDWSQKKKEKFANDPIHLRAVGAGINRSKGSDGPSDFMPPKKSYRCEYSKIWVDTANKYDLKLGKDDVKKLKSTLNKCGG